MVGIRRAGTAVGHHAHAYGSSRCWLWRVFVASPRCAPGRPAARRIGRVKLADSAAVTLGSRPSVRRLFPDNHDVLVLVESIGSVGSAIARRASPDLSVQRL